LHFPKGRHRNRLWEITVTQQLEKDILKLVTTLIANTKGEGQGEHISMQTLIKICEALDCGVADVIAQVPDDDP